MILDKDFYTLKEVGEKLIEANIITRKTEGKGYHTVSKLVNLPEDNERYLRSSMPNGRSGGRKISKEDLEVYIAKHSPVSDAIREYSNRVADLEKEIETLKKQLSAMPSVSFSNEHPSTLSFESILGSLPEDYQYVIKEHLDNRLHEQKKAYEEATNGLIDKNIRLENKLYGIVPFELNENTLFARFLGDAELFHDLRNSFKTNSDFTCSIFENGYSKKHRNFYDVRITKTPKRKKEIKLELLKVDFSNITLGNLEFLDINMIDIPFYLNNHKQIEFNYSNGRIQYGFDDNKYFMTNEFMEKIDKQLAKTTVHNAILKAILSNLKKKTKHKDVADYLAAKWGLL